MLDLSRLVAGNMLSLQLADFGADVIKVEPPAGDPLREWHDGGHELFWKTYARNKRSIVLNLRHEAARDAARGTQIGFVTPGGSTRRFRGRAVGATLVAVSPAAPMPAIAVIVRAGGQPLRLGPPTIVSADGRAYVADGQLQDALVGKGALHR